MVFTRFIAIALLLQGVGPAFLFGVWRPGGWFLTGLAGIYAFLATGFWQGRRWALPLAFALTLPQLFVLSCPLFSWSFLAFFSAGLGVVPDVANMDLRFFAYRSFGGRLSLSLGYNRSLISEYAPSGHQTFVLINALALPLLALLLIRFAINLIAAESSPEPNHALQPTAGASDPLSKFHG